MTIELTTALSYNPDKQTIKINGEQQKMTTKETALFDYLSKNKNTVSLRDNILTEVWGNTSYFNARSMDVYITRLRKIIAPLNETVSIINIHGKGYKLLIEDADDPTTV